MIHSHQLDENWNPIYPQNVPLGGMLRMPAKGGLYLRLRRVPSEENEIKFDHWFSSGPTFDRPPASHGSSSPAPAAALTPTTGVCRYHLCLSKEYQDGFCFKHACHKTQSCSVTCSGVKGHPGQCDDSIKEQ